MIPNPKKQQRKMNFLLVMTTLILCVTLCTYFFVSDHQQIIKYLTNQISSYQSKFFTNPKKAYKINSSEKSVIRDETFQKPDDNFNKGNNLLKGKQWEQAIKKFEQVRPYDPNFKGSKDAIQKAQFEKTCRDIIAKASSLMKLRLFSESAELLVQIPKQSVYYSDALKAFQTLRSENLHVIISSPGNIHATPSSTSKVLRVAPKGEMLTIIMSTGQWSKILSKGGSIGWMHQNAFPESAKKTFTGEHSVISKADRNHGTKNVSLEDEGLQLSEKALNYYINGNISLSLKMLDKVAQLKLPEKSLIKKDALTFKNAIVQISEFYEDGHQHYQKNQLPQAMGQWSQALESDRKIVGQENSFISSQIGIYTADFFYKKALDAIDQSNQEMAKKNCARAFRAQKEHPGCAEIMNPLTEGSQHKTK